MAKDGTVRGGARAGSGRKRKSLDEKILDGTESKTKAPLSSAEKRAREILKDAKASEEAAKKPKLETAVGTLPEVTDLEAADIPDVREYMLRQQKNGSYLIAKDVFRETWLWLKENGCNGLVPKQIVEQYAQSVARWIQCEEAISQYGYLGKHPTTGNPVSSPFVSMSKDYKKQVNTDWFVIWQIVKENGSMGYGTSNDDDLMEKLLSAKT